MKKNIDKLISELKSQPPARDLRNLEPEVWARIDAGKYNGSTGAPGAVFDSGRMFAASAWDQTSAVVLASAIGLFAGVLWTASNSTNSISNDVSVFAVDAPAAPSGRLG